MKQFVTQVLAATNGAMNIELGFVPDFAEVLVFGTLDASGNPDRYEWIRDAGGTIAGVTMITTGSTGVITKSVTAATMITAFNGTAALQAGISVGATIGNGTNYIVVKAYRAEIE